MVGLGETSEEVIKTMKQAYNVGVNIFTIGQSWFEYCFRIYIYKNGR